MATKGKQTTAVTRWDEALAARARVAQKAVASIGGSGDWISFKGGTITFHDSNIGNKLDVVIPSFVLENAFYIGKFDPNNPTPPVCYAFGTSEEEMVPHEAAAEPQAKSCATCPHNEWDSGDGGSGKACKNMVRLAALPADCLEGGADGIAGAKEAFAKVPVTSIKAWGGYVNSLASAGKHPLAVVTELTVTSDPKTQFKVAFRASESIDDGELIGALIDRADILDKTIGFAYPKPDERPTRPVRGSRAAAPAAPSRGKAAAKPSKATPAAPRRKF